MSRDLNLVRLLGAPEELACPCCGVSVQTHFDQYDTDGSYPVQTQGQLSVSTWQLYCHCAACDCSWHHTLPLVDAQRLLARLVEDIHDEWDDHADSYAAGVKWVLRKIADLQKEIGTPLVPTKPD